MFDPFYEKITNPESILDICRYLVDSRVTSKMEFPETGFIRITSFLKILETEPRCLQVDKVSEMEPAMKENPQGKVSFEFRDRERVPCYFHTVVVWAGPEGILVDVPDVIHRMQKREYFRMDTPLGSEITFWDPSGKLQQGTITDVSGQGASFLMKKEAAIKKKDLVTNIVLKLPAEGKILNAEIPRATVRRVEAAEGGKILAAVAFNGITERVKKDIISYIFERHRSLIRKIGR